MAATGKGLNTKGYFQGDVITVTGESQGKPAVEVSGILMDASNGKHTGEQRA